MLQVRFIKDRDLVELQVLVNKDIEMMTKFDHLVTNVQLTPVQTGVFTSFVATITYELKGLQE